MKIPVGPASDLVLAGFRLRIVAEGQNLLERVVAVMVPPCEAVPHRPGPDWTVWVEETEGPPGDEADVLFADRPVLAFPHGGPRLAVADQAGGVLRVVGRYRPDAAAAVIEVHAAQRATRVAVPAGDGVGGRWADWLARVFFASRMLAGGWRMLHASAVAVDGSAVVFLAGQREGKSTLAHRACVELGAAFLADDLVLIGPDRTVVGWPTRIALPAELAGPAPDRTVQHTVVAGVARQRVLLSPPEHRAALAAVYSPPVPLGAVVWVAPAPAGGGPAAAASPLTPAALEAAALQAMDVPAQRLHVSDLLGLTGGPHPDASTASRPGSAAPAAGPDASTASRPDASTASWPGSAAPAGGPADQVGAEPGKRGLLAGVPAAALRVSDMATLSQAPVWGALAGLLPQLAGP